MKNQLTIRERMPNCWGSLQFGAAPWLAVSFGGGTNSSAMLCGFYKRGIKPDVIIFADTGAEMPHTYAHVLEMRVRVGCWWGLDIVRVIPKKTIVEHCDKTAMLPSLAYGRRSCSQKFKHEPMETYLKEWAKENGASEIVKAIGYDAEEGYRAKGKPTEKQLCKGLREQYVYPLVEWQWRRNDCIKAIKCAGITQPGKSACYFCPASKRSEVVALKEHYPALLEKALEIETNSQKRHRTKIGLGGMGNLWSDWLAMDEAQIKMTRIVRDGLGQAARRLFSEQCFQDSSRLNENRNRSRKIARSHSPEAFFHCDRGELRAMAAPVFCFGPIAFRPISTGIECVRG